MQSERKLKVVRFSYSASAAALLGLTAAFSSQAPGAEEVEPISKIDIWNLPEAPIEPGGFEPNWESLEKYQAPEWFRAAKLGIWAHWDPQSVPEQGDWYARNMYVEGHRQNKHSVATYGHPSEFGYKDICALWTTDQWDPAGFVDLAVTAGGRYFVALANHHDNYDCWDSKYQPWNAVNLGPKKDVIGIWEKEARKRGLPFGVTVHASPARTWGQFMTARYTSDKSGPKKGVPYDALSATLQDGKGKAWEGLDPFDLYGPKHKPNEDANASPFANQFMWRVNDLLKYNPDLLYFDESTGTNMVDLGVKMGLGHLAPKIAANFYNKNLKANDGELTAVLNLKEVGGHRNSLDSVEEAEFVSRCLVKDSEKITESSIQAYPFQTDDTLGPWHMDINRPYRHDAKWVIRTLVENVSKNGNLLLNIPQRAQGNVDPEAVKICQNIGAWMGKYGEGIYNSRPFEVHLSQDGLTTRKNFKGLTEVKANVHFTRQGGYVYAFLLKWPNAEQKEGFDYTIAELAAGGATLGQVSKVELMGQGDLQFNHSSEGLQVTLPAEAPSNIASVLKITHDKGWVNEDDPGTKVQGWIHRVNRNRGEYNNDVFVATKKQAHFRYGFEGEQVTLVSNLSPDHGRLMILIDGEFDQVVDLAKGKTTAVQQMVYTSTKLPKGKHTIEIVTLDDKLATIDALIVK